MTPDELETRAQQIHSARHRAGTAPVCGPCRDEAAGVPRRSVLDRLRGTPQDHSHNLTDK